MDDLLAKSASKVIRTKDIFIDIRRRNVLMLNLVLSVTFVWECFGESTILSDICRVNMEFEHFRVDQHT